MGPVGLVVSVGLGAFLGAFFLCRICFLRGFLSLIMAKRVFVLLCPHLFERLFVKLCRARSNDCLLERNVL